MALRHVLHRTDALPRRIRMVHDVTVRSRVLDWAGRHQQAQFVGKGASAPASLRNELREQRTVIRVNPVANLLEADRGTRPQLENAIELVGEGDVVGVHPPGEAAGRTDSLSVCEQRFAAPELFLRL